MAVDEGQPHREGLGHADQCVVDRRIAVRVQAAHDLADDTGAFDVSAVVPQTHLAHLVKDPALHGLQTVAGIRQGA